MIKPTTDQHSEQEQYKDFKDIQHHFNEAEQACLQRMDKLIDELYRHQPFLLTMILDNAVGLRPREMNEMIVIYVALWFYFKRDLRAMNKKVTDTMFDRYRDANIKVLSAGDHDKMRATVLLALCLERFQTRPVLRQMKRQPKSGLLLGIKTLIDCFEEVVK